jgi:hypothetical protein
MDGEGCRSWATEGMLALTKVRTAGECAEADVEREPNVFPFVEDLAQMSEKLDA